MQKHMLSHHHLRIHSIWFRNATYGRRGRTSDRPSCKHGVTTSRMKNIPPANIAPAPTPQSYKMLQGNAPSKYYQDYPTNANLASTTLLDSEESGQSPFNNVKPLPRFIGEVDVPGEGPSWFYEDGTTSRKVIDGEPVNTQWGVTKAGKRRKRLAIACTICRQKKIKCNPAEPKCVQCEEFGRECSFTTVLARAEHSDHMPNTAATVNTNALARV